MGNLIFITYFKMSKRSDVNDVQKNVMADYFINNPKTIRNSFTYIYEYEYTVHSYDHYGDNSESWLKWTTFVITYRHSILFFTYFPFN